MSLSLAACVPEGDLLLAQFTRATLPAQRMYKLPSVPWVCVRVCMCVFLCSVTNEVQSPKSHFKGLVRGTDLLIQNHSLNYHLACVCVWIGGLRADLVVLTRPLGTRDGANLGTAGLAGEGLPTCWSVFAFLFAGYLWCRVLLVFLILSTL